MNSINLLPSKGEGILSQFLSWALTIGRLLIILTETLALSTFIYRFSLDMRIVDLHDQIRSESAIVANWKTSEDKFRNLQTRLALAKEYSATSDQIPKVFRELTEMGRGKVTFKSLIVSNDLVKAEIQAPSATALSKFVNAAKGYPLIESVSVDQVESKTSNATITVALTMQLKKTQAVSQSTIAQPVTQPEGGN